jgi:pyruvate dehydrogenase E2 component (dihydrolipoamide acetyltransferase)
MPIQVLMPALSPTMTEGTLAKWLKAEGDAIEPGDIIAEVETDKATMEVEAIEEGVLGKILIAEGTEAVPINTPIAVVLEEGEDAGAMEGLSAAPANGGAPAAAAEPAPAPAPAPAPSAPAASAPAAAPAAAPPAPSRDGARIFASPLARRMAEQANIDLASLNGSGPNGRIVKRDIEAAVAGGAAAVPAPAEARAPVAPLVEPTAPYTEIANSGMRKVIAKRLLESKQTVPHIYLTVDCEVDALLGVRKDLNARSDAYKISVNDFVIRAMALALRKVPTANASWTDAATLQYNTVDVAVAVAVDGGLVTPVVRNADNKGLAQISEEMKDFAERARDGKLMPEEYQGGTFSISNLGMYGISEFSAIINPPQAGILAIGAGEQRPVVKDGALAVATVMSCTLSCDHRVIDGAVGAELLGAFKGLIEDPLTMLL